LCASRLSHSEDREGRKQAPHAGMIPGMSFETSTPEG
jgi:hypothetical protein